MEEVLVNYYPQTDRVDLFLGEKKLNLSLEDFVLLADTLSKQMVQMEKFAPSKIKKIRKDYCHNGFVAVK